MPFDTLFPTTIYYNDLSTPDDIQQGMVEYVESFLEKNKDNVEDQNITGDVHNDFLIHQNPKFFWLNQKISECCKEYLFDMGMNTDSISIYAQKSWPIVCHKNGGSVSKHTHKNSVISAVYYLRCDNNKSGKLVFHNENCLDTLPLGFNIKNPLNIKKFHYKPIEKRLILFPSNVPHSVEEYIGENHRFSISYDLTIVRNKKSLFDNENRILDPSHWKEI